MVQEKEGERKQKLQREYAQQIKEHNNIELPLVSQIKVRIYIYIYIYIYALLFDYIYICIED